MRSESFSRRWRGRRLAVVLALVLSGLAGLAVTPASAASTINVGPAVQDGYNTGDGCSLYEAFALIAALQSGGSETNDCGSTSSLEWPVTVSLASNYTYTLNAVTDLPSTGTATAFPVLNDPDSHVIIEGNGATIERASSATDDFRFFYVWNSAKLELRDVTLLNGDVVSFSEVGGAIFIGNGAQLSIVNSTFSGNTALYGGAVYADEGTQVSIDSSTFSRNTALDDGGAIFVGGDEGDAIYVGSILQSTFSGNTAREGGAIFAVSDFSVTNTTFSGNSTTSEMSGSAIYLANDATADLAFVTFADHTGSPTLAVGYGGPGTFRLKNVVLANPSVDECENDAALTVQTAGVVLADDSSCSGAMVVSTLRSTLGPLASNGGPTTTHALLATSPAIGAVPSGACTDWNGNAVATDQRGQPRPNPSGTKCDAGAYESERDTPSGGIDLLVTGLTVREQGRLFCVTATVKNQGSAPAPSTSLRLALSSTASGGTPVATSSVPALGPGSTATLTRCLSLPNDTRRWLVATVDPFNTVAETDETNNTRAVRFR
jgi:predicted outer membrane repeat protein